MVGEFDVELDLPHLVGALAFRAPDPFEETAVVTLVRRVIEAAWTIPDIINVGVMSRWTETVAANARFGGDVSKVPTMALTVGVKTVLDAREVVVIITGENKAHALAQCVEGGINHMWTVSALQMHPKVVMVVDEDATMELKVRTVQYFRTLASRENELEKRQANASKRLSKL